MRNQIIVTIGREHGSAGHTIAQMLAEQLKIKAYDKNILEEAVGINSYNKEIISKADEKSVNLFLSRRIREYSNSIEENIAEKVFDFMRNKADSDESFVVVGRCADYILRKNPNVIRVFISGEYQNKVNRIMERNGISESAAEDIIRKTDHRRKSYHNYFSETKWGDSRYYDVLINSSKLGIPKTVDALRYYVQLFINE